MIHSPSLVQGVYSKRSEFFSLEDMQRYVTVNVFGIPKWAWKQFAPLIPALSVPLLNHILREPSATTLIDITVKNLEEQTANFVSFMPGYIDQPFWERSSNAKLTEKKDGRQAMEVSLLPILRDFLAVQAMPAVFGTDLLRNYPDILTDVWTFDNAFMIFMTALPRWIPIPKLSKAYAARSRLHSAFKNMHAAMEDDIAGRPVPSSWSNIDDISECIKGVKWCITSTRYQCKCEQRPISPFSGH